jgi:hypothetical protein
MLRAFVVLATICVVVGLALIVTGVGILPGVLLLILGLLGEALGFVISEGLRLKNSAQEWIALFSEGRPRSLRLVSVEPPRGFILNPDATVTLEVESKSGTPKVHEQGVPVPRLYAFFWKLATWLRIPLPKRLDFERMARLQLRRAEAEAESAPPAGTLPA